MAPAPATGCLHSWLLYAMVLWSFYLLTLHKHEHPHAEGDACGTYGRDTVLDSIIVNVIIVRGSSLLYGPGWCV